MNKEALTTNARFPCPGLSAGSRMRCGAPYIVSRRDFLVRTGGALAALSLGPAACSDGVTGPVVTEPIDTGDTRQPVDVIVVGAGLSGLVSAYELGRAGYDVIVLEAQEEAGGRVRTLREPFDDGLIAEAGAARIPPTHDRTLGYIDHFGIRTSPFYPQDREYLIVPPQGDPQRATPFAFLNEFFSGRDSWLKIPGGAQLLPQAFADVLGDRIRYASPVTKIVQGGSRVVVTFDAGSSEELEGSHVICTVPLPVIDRIDFEPRLSEEKRAAFAALGYDDVTRVYVQYESRIWERDGLNGWGVSLSGEFSEFWHPTWDLEGPRGLLMSYLFGGQARQIAAMDSGTVVSTFIDRFDGLFPGSAEVAERGTHFAWEHQPWIGAAFALHDPPFEEHPALASPEGRIHFAGEHASGDRGWMQGALVSGLRAASEIDPGVTGESSAQAAAILAGDGRGSLWLNPRAQTPTVGRLLRPGYPPGHSLRA